MPQRLKSLLFGPPRNLRDPNVFHHVSLMAFLAWVGLGADGLSSSAYGPEEAYKALGPHTHLSVLLILMTALTIVIISVAYSNLIEHFPGGGGGYLVATKLLGARAGVVSGCALLVDYVLTISVSIASGCDALWSFLPPAWAPYKFTVAAGAIGLLMLLNIRGVRESVTVLAPIFMLFVVTHAIMIFYVIGSRFTQLPGIFHGAAIDFHGSVRSLGFFPIAMILLRAYSLGGGTYTGIEAVSNGVSMLREPRVQTGKRTMFLMAASLAFMAAGILFGYMLTAIQPVDGKTMNAVLFEALFQSWHVGAFPVGKIFIVISLVSEAMLLFVAAQAGFLDGPRVLANMAVDSWVPRRFSQLSERLVARNGIFVMGLAALATLFYTKGSIGTLVVMYSINVFLTFTMTELGMARHWITHRHEEPRWKKQLAIHGTGLVMCAGILLVTLYEKFAEGGWVTAAITTVTIALCFLIRSHYRHVAKQFAALDEALRQETALETVSAESNIVDKNARTAILTVSGFSGFGIHHLTTLQKLMPGYIENIVFVSISVVDSGNFKAHDEIGRLEARTKADLEKYVKWSKCQGLKADYRMATATEAILGMEQLCRDVVREFPKAIVFSGKLVFAKDRWFQGFLHNETAYVLQRRLLFSGIQTVILPIRAG